MECKIKIERLQTCAVESRKVWNQLAWSSSALIVRWTSNKDLSISSPTSFVMRPTCHKLSLRDMSSTTLSACEKKRLSDRGQNLGHGNATICDEQEKEAYSITSTTAFTSEIICPVLAATPSDTRFSMSAVFVNTCLKNWQQHYVV